MTLNHMRPVLVAGGGIGGCAVALALARRGIPVRLMEQASELKEIGAGIQLGPNAFRVFDALGLRQEVEKVVVYPQALVMRDAVSAETVTRVPLGDPFIARFGQPYGVIYRADLHRILVQACSAQPLVELMTGTKLQDFSDDGNSVRVTTADGRELEGLALVGCDGLWSHVRQTIVGDGKPRLSGHIAYRAVLPTSDMPPDLLANEMVLWAGPKLHLVQYPLRGGELYNLVAVFHSDKYEEGWDSFGDVGELRSRFASACEQVQRLLEKIETWKMWVLCDREPVLNWTKGRATLLGDAAHPMLQYLAQGACMAMEDAMVLADELAGDIERPEAAFQRYQARRSMRTCRVQLTARLYGAAYHADGAVREMRNSYLRQRTPDAGMESLAWLYDPI